jgi:hypothetical protein
MKSYTSYEADIKIGVVMLNIVFKEFPKTFYHHFLYPLLRKVTMDEGTKGSKETIG